MKPLLAAQLLVVAAMLMVGVQAAVASTLAITQPVNTSSISATAPMFSGTSDTTGSDTVTLTIHSGASVAGPIVGSPFNATGATTGTWTVRSPSSLEDGTYTVEAKQDATTATSRFTVTSPHLTLDVPADGSTTSDSTPGLSGSAGTASGDSNVITVNIYAGTSASGTPQAAMSVPQTGGAWSAGSPQLADGIYTAQAVQSVTGGNNKSAPHTFTVNTGPPPPPANRPPLASFVFFPGSPLTGDTITLVSTSSDPDGPIASSAWDLKDDNKFADATGPTATVSFATPGTHRVRLRVTDAQGASSVAEAIITLGSRPTGPTPVARPALMSPFPVVRIAGSFTSSGADIRVLSINAPRGAHIDVHCTGRGCPRTRQTKVASVGPVARSAKLVRFGRFEHSLRAGVVLEIRITQTGRIGKYTRFTIRRGKAPSRIDRCLMPRRSTPVSCPSQ